MKITNHYFKKVIVYCILAVLAAYVVFAGEGYTIGGTIRCREQGTLYVYLVDEETFSVPLTGIRKQIIRVDDTDSRIGFIFKDVAGGRYGISGKLVVCNSKL